MDNLVLPHMILMHDSSKLMIWLMEIVSIPGITKSMVHVNGKEKIGATHKILVE